MGKFKSDKDRHRYEHEQFYIKSTDEMYKLFKSTPKAIENTVRIAELCNVDIPIGVVPNNETGSLFLIIPNGSPLKI